MPRIPRPTLADEAAVAVRRGIVAGDYRPGELYSVQRVADALGVSRSPAREALLRLAESGLIRFERNRGFVVVYPESREIAEIFATRLALEPLAARRAALNPAGLASIESAFVEALRTADASDETGFRSADRALHDAILSAAGNTRISEIVTGLRESTMLIQEPTWTRTRALAEVATEHEPIVDAIRSADPDRAESAMRSHLRSTALLLMAQAAEVPPGSETIDALWLDVAGTA